MSTDSNHLTAPAVVLPQQYYLDHFFTILNQLTEHAGHLLEEQERTLIRTILELPREACSLFVRLSNRKGELFRLSRLCYAEIGDVEAAAEVLARHRLVVLHDPGDPAFRHADAESILALFTKAELEGGCRRLALRPGAAALRKPELVSKIMEMGEAGRLLDLLSAEDRIIRFAAASDIEMLRLLYFGTTREDCTPFVLRDLGMRRYAVSDEQPFTPRFPDRAAANSYFAVARQKTILRQLVEAGAETAEILKGFSGIVRPEAGHGDALEKYERLALEVAGHLERQRALEDALAVYARTDKAPSRERRARILMALGRGDECKTLLARMDSAPQNADERLFAADYLAKLTAARPTVRATTSELREADVRELPRKWKNRVEEGVMDLLAEEGYSAAHAENYLWRSLFGLLLWDCIFDPAAGVFSPFSHRPRDLYSPDFAASRRERIDSRLKLLEDREALKRALQESYFANIGVENSFFNWRKNPLDLINCCCRLLDPAQLRAVLEEMLRNTRDNLRGFPDLFCWRETSCRFIEVKGPGDTLSAQQLHWLQTFSRLDIPVEVLRVRWR